MWQPHTKVNTQTGETGFESWWTLLGCLWHPPSLPEWFPLGFLLFSALEVPRGDHTLQDSQQSVVYHERAPFQELESDTTGIPQRAVQGQESSAFRSLLSTLSWLWVSSAWRSSMCLCSTSSSAGIESVRKFSGTVEAMSLFGRGPTDDGHVAGWDSVFLASPCVLRNFPNALHVIGSRKIVPEVCWSFGLCVH